MLNKISKFVFYTTILHMPLLVYRPNLFQNTAENLQFRALCTELKRRIEANDSKGGSKKSLCIMVGNFNFAEKEFDAFIIKKEGIVLLEFKNYGGRITVSNNEWKGEPDGRPFVIKGGSGGKTPLEQARLNRNAFIRNITGSFALTDEQAQRISTLVVFNHKCDIDNKLRFNVQTWLNITDNTDFFGAMESIVDKDMNLTPIDMRRIADRIVLDDGDIVEEFSDVAFLNDIWGNPAALKQFSDSCEGIVEFPDEPDPFVADQEGELDMNPEQAGAIEQPSLFEQEVLPGQTPDEAIPCEIVPPMIGNYISLIQQAVLPGISYCIYDCTESVPQVSFDISKRYLIKVLTDPQERTAKDLGSFVHQTVHLGLNCLYWTFGESIPTVKHHDEDTTPESGLVFRNSSTILAPWLDSFIFEKLGASYDPRYKRFAYNDDLTEEEARIYLGTYFPRSYAEHFLIFENLLSNPVFRSKLEAKRHLSVFSIGAGTGGDIVGLLTAIDKFLPSNIGITVIALDANQNSLNLQKEVIDRYCSISAREISLTQFCDRIENEGTLQKYSDNALPDGSLDIILFAKVGCELHGKSIFGNENVYEVCMRQFASKLSENGVFSALDVTTNVDGKTFMPFILNKGVNDFTAKNASYSTVLPLSCHFFEKKCDVPCFIQQEFSVSHCKKSRDLSRVCYRIIARKEFSDAITNNNAKRFIITPSKTIQEPNEAICHLSQNYTEVGDAFNLNQ